MPDIQVTQIDPNTGAVTLGIGNNPKILTGIDLLAQVVALSFLRNPGQNVLAFTEGSGIRQDIGQTSISSVDQANMLVMQRAKIVEQEVISRQVVAVGDPSENLLSLTVLSVASDLDTASAAAVVKIVNETGDSTTILV